MLGLSTGRPSGPKTIAQINFLCASSVGVHVCLIRSLQVKSRYSTMYCYHVYTIANVSFINMVSICYN